MGCRAIGAPGHRGAGPRATRSPFCCQALLRVAWAEYCPPAPGRGASRGSQGGGLDRQATSKPGGLERRFSSLAMVAAARKVEVEPLRKAVGGLLAALPTELLSAVPGVDEAVGFAEMLKLVDSLAYSVVVFDTAPTGHTLRLLQLPEAMAAWALLMNG